MMRLSKALAVVLLMAALILPGCGWSRPKQTDMGLEVAAVLCALLQGDLGAALAGGARIVWRGDKEAFWRACAAQGSGVMVMEWSERNRPDADDTILSLRVTERDTVEMCVLVAK